MGNLLDADSCKTAFERIGLSVRASEVAREVIGLMGDDNRINVEAIRREVYGVPDLNQPQSANVQLNRLLRLINVAAEQSGMVFKACITPDKKSGAAKRWVWFEGPLPKAPRFLARELDGMGFEKPINRQGILGAQPTTEDTGVALPSNQRSVDVTEALLSWATQADSPPVFALLGDYGMGKTVTCQHFAKLLEEKREHDFTLPHPLYFDLQSVTGLEQRVPAVEEVMLECARRDWVLPSRDDTAILKMINQYLDQGAVAIFDGLDEVLVKLTDTQGVAFTQNLLHLSDKVKARREEADGPPLKMLVSSRPQYFRSLRDERNHLTGGAWDNTGENALQTIALLPFEDEQVRQYFSHVIAESEVPRAMELVCELNNMEELTHCPYTLSHIAKRLPAIKLAREEGRTLNTATLYRELARCLLDRDSGKHRISPQHKLSLAASLTAHLWKTRTSSIPVDDLENWFHDWLETQPTIHRLYKNLHHSLLEEDVRTTTFLSRIDLNANDSSYRFAHPSLQEFFLAEYLVNAIRKNEPQLWEADSPQGTVLCPSMDTLDFMGQILAEENDHELLDTLERWARTASSSVNTILLHYSLRAASRNYPCPPLRGIQPVGQTVPTRFQRNPPTHNRGGHDYSDRSF